MLVIAAAIVVLTGPIANQVGTAFGIGHAAVLIWDIAKWPVLVIIVSVMYSLLYKASPNVRQPAFRWVSAGGILAVIIWLIASGLFAVYVSFSGSYNKTYGSLATVIIFLVWLWISNIAILLGAEFNAETQRERAIRAGLPEDVEPFAELRDTRNSTTRRNAGSNKPGAPGTEPWIKNAEVPSRLTSPPGTCSPRPPSRPRVSPGHRRHSGRTCHLGVTFDRPHGEKSAMRTSVAQAFAGERRRVRAARQPVGAEEPMPPGDIRG